MVGILVRYCAACPFYHLEVTKQTLDRTNADMYEECFVRPTHQATRQPGPITYEDWQGIQLSVTDRATVLNSLKLSTR